jgi:predicted methyltransferase
VLAAVLAAALAGPGWTVAEAQVRPAHGRLFPPEDLGMLEGPDRDAWQEPELIMDALGIADGAVVADVGAGGGWFTVRLAQRVGPNGLVYAEDIQPQMIESINRRVRRAGLTNVQPVIGTPSNPLLPGPIDALLMVEVYGQVEDPVALLRNVKPRLKPGGRVGIVEYKLDGFGPGPPLDERVEPGTVIRDASAAGFRLLAREDDFRYQYLLVFVPDEAGPPAG